MQSLPLRFVEDYIVRSFSKFEHKFSIVYAKKEIFQLTEQVEQYIGRIMKGKKGAIVHDGLTNNSTH